MMRVAKPSKQTIATRGSINTCFEYARGLRRHPTSVPIRVDNFSGLATTSFVAQSPGFNPETLDLTTLVGRKTIVVISTGSFLLTHFCTWKGRFVTNRTYPMSTWSAVSCVGRVFPLNLYARSWSEPSMSRNADSKSPTTHFIVPTKKSWPGISSISGRF